VDLIYKGKKESPVRKKLRKGRGEGALGEQKLGLKRV